jgi:hypothetical protein
MWRNAVGDPWMIMEDREKERISVWTRNGFGDATEGWNATFSQETVLLATTVSFMRA